MWRRRQCPGRAPPDGDSAGGAVDAADPLDVRHEPGRAVYPFVDEPSRPCSGEPTGGTPTLTKGEKIKVTAEGFLPGDASANGEDVGFNWTTVRRPSPTWPPATAARSPAMRWTWPVQHRRRQPLARAQGRHQRHHAFAFKVGAAAGTTAGTPRTPPWGHRRSRRRRRAPPVGDTSGTTGDLSSGGTGGTSDSGTSGDLSSGGTSGGGGCGPLAATGASGSSRSACSPSALVDGRRLRGLPGAQGRQPRPQLRPTPRD